MLYRAKTKELLGSFRTIIDADLLASLEQLRLYGDAVRSETRERFCYGNAEEGREDHWLKVSVYRPKELVAGVPCLARTLRKPRRGSWLYKIVLIPHAHRLAEEALEEVAPGDFWQIAYWQYVQMPVPVDAEYPPPGAL